MFTEFVVWHSLSKIYSKKVTGNLQLQSSLNEKTFYFIFFPKQEEELIQVKHLFPKVLYLKTRACE